MPPPRHPPPPHVRPRTPPLSPGRLWSPPPHLSLAALCFTCFCASVARRSAGCGPRRAGWARRVRLARRRRAREPCAGRSQCAVTATVPATAAGRGRRSARAMEMERAPCALCTLSGKGTLCTAVRKGHPKQPQTQCTAVRAGVAEARRAGVAEARGARRRRARCSPRLPVHCAVASCHGPVLVRAGPAVTVWHSAVTQSWQ
jgi:hypothetical protein